MKKKKKKNGEWPKKKGGGETIDKNLPQLAQITKIPYQLDDDRPGTW